MQDRHAWLVRSQMAHGLPWGETVAEKGYRIILARRTTGMATQTMACGDARMVRKWEWQWTKFDEICSFGADVAHTPLDPH